MYQQSAGKEARALKNASLGWEAGNLTLRLFVPYGCGKVDTLLHSETSLNKMGMILFIGASEPSGEVQEVCSTVPGLQDDQLPAHNPRGLLIVVRHLYQAWCSLLNEARSFLLGRALKLLGESVCPSLPTACQASKWHGQSAQVHRMEPCLLREQHPWA